MDSVMIDRKGRKSILHYYFARVTPVFSRRRVPLSVTSVDSPPPYTTLSLVVAHNSFSTSASLGSSSTSHCECARTEVRLKSARLKKQL